VVAAQPNQGGGSEPLNPGQQGTGNPWLDQLKNPLVNPLPGAITQFFIPRLLSTIGSVLNDTPFVVDLGGRTYYADKLMPLPGLAPTSQIHNFASSVDTTHAGMSYLAPISSPTIQTHDTALAHWINLHSFANRTNPIARWVTNQGLPQRKILTS
jgi:hypothetical protein